MTAHECEEYIEEPPQRKRYALRKPERQRDFLRLKLTLPSERRTGKPPPDPLLVLCRLQIHRGSRCSTVTKIPDTTVGTIGFGPDPLINRSSQFTGPKLNPQRPKSSSFIRQAQTYFPSRTEDIMPGNNLSWPTTIFKKAVD